MEIPAGLIIKIEMKEVDLTCLLIVTVQSGRARLPERAEGCRHVGCGFGGVSVGMEDLLYFVARTDAGGDRRGSRRPSVELT